MQSTFKSEERVTVIRKWLLLFIILLVFSGLTAIPVEWELATVLPFIQPNTALAEWLNDVYTGVRETGNKYPFLLYGYDWLAFSHFVIALAFIGPYKDPVRNKWVIEFGMYACLLIIPFALVAGHFRGIPLWWRICDCMFGVIGILPLSICYKEILKLETLFTKNQNV